MEGFLTYISSTFAMECPTRRCSEEEAPLRMLPSDMSQVDVYKEYVNVFPKLSGAAKEWLPQEPPKSPLTFSTFLRYWDRGHSTLRLAKKGSEFCDFCTSTRNDIANIHLSDARHACLSDLLERHRDQARSEHENYKSFLTESYGKHNGACQHIVFDFAEKVLLLQLMRQPGQLYFVTGLKFDLFGIHDRNKGRTYIYGLTEGHWPNEKTANTVVSMLHHCISRNIVVHHDQGIINQLVLHADNYAGQNKNPFVLMYLCWRTIVLFHSIKTSRWGLWWQDTRRM